jgi:UDP-3-O-[3-hydroxymyristoyl] glucosamine N-acyltransferase
MNPPRPYTLDEIAERVGGAIRPEGAGASHQAGAARSESTGLTGVAPIDSAGEGSVTWISDVRYEKYLPGCRASAILAPVDFGATPMPAILCDNMAASVGRLINLFAPETPTPPVGVDPKAHVDPSAKLGDGVRIGPFVEIAAGASVGPGTALHSGVYLGAGVEVGADCRLWNGVVIRERCRAGDRVEIHPNTVIGADGFGFFRDPDLGQAVKIAHYGVVEIESDVEIGACCCVDRAKIGVTRIGRGTKIDNLVQVAHNAKIGENCLITAHSSLAGSAVIEENVILAGYAGVREHARVGRGGVVLAHSVVTKDMPEGCVVGGIPARDRRSGLREMAAAQKLPELLRTVKDLKRRVDQLENSADDTQAG